MSRTSRDKGPANALLVRQREKKLGTKRSKEGAQEKQPKRLRVNRLECMGVYSAGGDRLLHSNRTKS